MHSNRREALSNFNKKRPSQSIKFIVRKFKEKISRNCDNFFDQLIKRTLIFQCPQKVTKLYFPGTDGLIPCYYEVVTSQES